MKTPLKTAALVATGAALLIGGTAAAHWLAPDEAANAFAAAPAPALAKSHAPAQADTRGVHPGGELAPMRLAASAAGKITINAVDYNNVWLSPTEFQPSGDPRGCALVLDDRYNQKDFIYKAVGPCTKYVARLPVPEGAALTYVRGIGIDQDDTQAMQVGIDWPQVTDKGSVGVATDPGRASWDGADMPEVLEWGGGWNDRIVDYTHKSATSSDIVTTYPMVTLTVPPSNDLRIIGVSVTWRPTYGTSVATPTFSDVPAAHAYSNEVESLAKAGISNGCGGGKFCVDAPVTRAQMAVFLSRALGLYDETADDQTAQ